MQRLGDTEGVVLSASASSHTRRFGLLSSLGGRNIFVKVGHDHPQEMSRTIKDAYCGCLFLKLALCVNIFYYQPYRPYVYLKHPCTIKAFRLSPRANAPSPERLGRGSRSNRQSSIATSSDNDTRHHDPRVRRLLKI